MIGIVEEAEELGLATLLVKFNDLTKVSSENDLIPDTVSSPLYSTIIQSCQHNPLTQ